MIRISDAENTFDELSGKMYNSVNGRVVLLLSVYPPQVRKTDSLMSGRDQYVIAKGEKNTRYWWLRGRW